MSRGVKEVVVENQEGERESRSVIFPDESGWLWGAEKYRLSTRTTKRTSVGELELSPRGFPRRGRSKNRGLIISAAIFIEPIELSDADRRPDWSAFSKIAAARSSAAIAKNKRW